MVAKRFKRPKRPSRRWITLLVLLTVVIGFSFTLPMDVYLQALIEWTQGLGRGSAVVFTLIFTGTILILIPATILTLAAGFAFGVFWGTVIVMIASLAGAGLAFLIGRTLARDVVDAKVSDNRRFRRFDRTIGRQGFKIVFLLRLSPIFPFTLINYALGLTSVQFTTYLLATAIGIFPAALLYVYVGAVAEDLTQIFSVDPGGGRGLQIVNLAGLVATVIVTVIVTRIARRALKDPPPARDAPAIPEFDPQTSEHATDTRS